MSCQFNYINGTAVTEDKLLGIPLESPVVPSASVLCGGWLIQIYGLYVMKPLFFTTWLAHICEMLICFVTAESAHLHVR